MNTKFLLLIIVKFLCALVYAQYIGKQCLTPNLETAYCQEISSCIHMYNALKNAVIKNTTVSNARIINFVRASHEPCGFRRRLPMVCCGTQVTYVQDCGHQKVDEERIYGGNKTLVDEFPWIVLLNYKTKNNDTLFRCAGSLISNRHVLTAAHCVIDELIGVRLGEHDITTTKECSNSNCTEPKDIEIEEKFIQSDFTTNDIALLKLKEEVDFFDNIRPICLPSTYELPENTVLTVAGWGMTENSTSSSIKLKLNLPQKPINECAEALHLRDLNDNHICAGGNAGEDTCRGDSGGPLMLPVNESNGGRRWYLYGIVSLGSGNCEIGYPGVYTKVSKYVEWIEKNMMDVDN